jgi:hypothetical protein
MRALAARLLDSVSQCTGGSRSPNCTEVEIEVLDVANLVVLHFARPDTSVCVDDTTESARRTPSSDAAAIGDVQNDFTSHRILGTQPCGPDVAAMPTHATSVSAAPLEYSARIDSCRR